MVTTATTKGQIVIPAAMRRRLGIVKGTRIELRVNEGEGTITLLPITDAFVRRMRGKHKGTALLKELEHMRNSDREREEAKERAGRGK
jgi:AbrB family looped-hinge helix DNA binding protein